MTILTDDAVKAAHRLPSGDGLVAYFEDRRPPGDFLRAVLENDLMRAAARADEHNGPALPHYAHWLYNHAPAYGKAWGSKNAVRAWLKGEVAP